MVNTTLFCKILKKIAIYFGKQKKSDRIQNTKNNQSNKRKTMISLLKITAFTSLATVLFSGCAPMMSAAQYIAETTNPKIGTTEVDGIFIPREAVIEDNKNSSVYYKNINSELIKKDLLNIAKHLNENQPFVPKYWCEIDDNLKPTCKENIENNFIENMEFFVDEDTYNIISNKQYSASKDTYKDFYNIKEYLFETTSKNSILREEFGISGILYENDDDLKNKKLSFTTARGKSDRFLRDDIKKQIEVGGWKMAEKPEDADKVVTFSLTRGYTGYEFEEIKKSKKAFDFTWTLEVVLSDMSRTTHTYNIITDYYNDEVNTNIHTRGNTSATNAGVAAGGAFIALDLLFSSNNRKKTIRNKEYLFPVFLIEDKASGKINLLEINAGMLPDSNKGKNRLLREISFRLNQNPDSNSGKAEIK